MASKRRQRRRATAGYKQHLFDSGEPVSDELLVAHRELELCRAGAYVNRTHSDAARHIDKRFRKLQEVS